MKSIRYFAVAAFLTLLPIVANASSTIKHVAVKTTSVKHIATPQGPFTCPVTGDKIASVNDAVGSSVYKGKTYYFCCSECKPMFDKDPAKYAKPTKK